MDRDVPVMDCERVDLVFEGIDMECEGAVMEYVAVVLYCDSNDLPYNGSVIRNENK